MKNHFTREVCVNESKETYEQKPKYVDEKYCEDITTSCKPVTKTSCIDYVGNNEVCMDKPKEKCVDESKPVSTYKKEYEYREVLVEDLHFKASSSSAITNPLITTKCRFLSIF